jgi:glycosyltransferase involved in cell wall biosynthesis
MNKIDFSIVTPSYNMLRYLKLCAASISDQKDVSFEHIVVDAQSNDGTVDWLKSQSNIRIIIEPDNGMYDAINKGLINAKGDILAYLNCDEQYLPDTLAFVKEYFTIHQNVDMLFGNFYAVNPNGNLISYRKSFQPRWYYIQATHLYVFTCAMFFRRKLIEDGIFFDGSYQSIADSIFVVKVLRNHYNVNHVNRYFSTFTVTSDNKLSSSSSLKEVERLNSTKDLWLFHRMKYPLNALRVMEKFIHGCYFEIFPISYKIYVEDILDERKTFTIFKGSPKWLSNK